MIGVSEAIGIGQCTSHTQTHVVSSKFDLGKTTSTMYMLWFKNFQTSLIFISPLSQIYGNEYVQRK